MDGSVGERLLIRKVHSAPRCGLSNKDQTEKASGEEAQGTGRAPSPSLQRSGPGRSAAPGPRARGSDRGGFRGGGPRRAARSFVSQTRRALKAVPETRHVLLGPGQK